jgi:peptidoglycan hydrolase-like protein with peptidoglycan-binding domain
MATQITRRGSSGADVRELQEKLRLLGFDLRTDGVFGESTERSVRQLQALFGLEPDGLVGQETKHLVDEQIASGWNVTLPDAQELALRAQGKQPGTKGGIGTGRDGQNVVEVPRAPTWPDGMHTAAPASHDSPIAPGASKPVPPKKKKPSSDR